MLVSDRGNNCNRYLSFWFCIGGGPNASMPVTGLVTKGWILGIELVVASDWLWWYSSSRAFWISFKTIGFTISFNFLETCYMISRTPFTICWHITNEIGIAISSTCAMVFGTSPSLSTQYFKIKSDWLVVVAIHTSWVLTTTDVGIVNVALTLAWTVMWWMEDHFVGGSIFYFPDRNCICQGWFVGRVANLSDVTRFPLGMLILCWCGIPLAMVMTKYQKLILLR